MTRILEQSPLKNKISEHKKNAVRTRILSGPECCPDQNAVRTRILSGPECCPDQNSVRSRILSGPECCPDQNAVRTRILSGPECCPVQNAVRTRMLSGPEFCPDQNAVRTRMSDGSVNYFTNFELNKRVFVLVTGCRCMSRENPGVASALHRNWNISPDTSD